MVFNSEYFKREFPKFTFTDLDLGLREIILEEMDMQLKPSDLTSRRTCRTLLDAGAHPISNRYLRSPLEVQKPYPLILGQCGKTGIVNLMTPFPVEELRPRFDWIVYNEPEAHLGLLAEIAYRICGLSRESMVGGISYKDLPLLQRLKPLGTHTWRISSREDLGLARENVGVETIQYLLNEKIGAAIASRYALSDLLIVRHILEHSYCTEEFVAALRCMIKSDGYILFEVPDCSRQLENCDYTMLWEEHLYYFTPETFRYFLELFGFSVCHFETIHYPYENCIVAIVKNGDISFEEPSLNDLEPLETGAKFFAESFRGHRDKVLNTIRELREQYGKICLLGAGHLACTFLWVFGLEEFIEFVIDDDINKQGLYMPGVALPIVSFSRIYEKDISVCLLAANPMNHKKIIDAHPTFLQNGGRFMSIFPGTENFLLDSFKP